MKVNASVRRRKVYLGLYDFPSLSDRYPSLVTGDWLNAEEI